MCKKRNQYGDNVILKYIGIKKGAILLGLGLLVACSSGDRLDSIQQKKILMAVTRNAPTTWYEGRDGNAGFEYELAKSFAAYLDVELKLVTKDSVSGILEMIQQGKADIAVAGLTRTAERENGFLFGPAYQEVTQQVVCRRGGAHPKSIKGLADVELVVPSDSSYVERLQSLKLRYPGIHWRENSSLNTESLLEQVWKKELECTIADSNIVAINRRYFPELSVRFDLGKPQSLAWMLPADAAHLREKVKAWYEVIDNNGELTALKGKYYGYIGAFDYVDTRTLTRRIKRLLPKFRPMFEAAGIRYGIDWTLLAAQSYQESHWNPRAKSPTGVRGIMMLTLTTAKELGIKSRLNAKENIMGGAKYLSQMQKRLPQSMTEHDREWMALAAYNIGFGHMRDVFVLSKRLKRNPDLWTDVSTVLPLLGRKKYYKTLKHGYARGWEPVRYVKRIRDYQDIIVRNLERQEVAGQ
ncbi:MAG: membrane-bound lytic murein transglycosylase MltF [Mariprofundaceae bacterium]|nr:membrane-bound lytic murein transglycosylase MltF [Mariprofundaceae bacterium]